MSKHLIIVDHDYLRYANCWEDADLLLSGLEISEGDKVLSIGSAGDNSFSLLTGDPELIVAVDVNPAQLQLIELKKAAIKTLDYSAFLQFLGFEVCQKRAALFGKVSTALSESSKQWWSMRLEEINAGIIYQGKFEKYFELFRRRVLPLIHTKKRVDALFQSKDNKQQVDYFNNKWNSFRWNALFRIFFSKRLMGKLGRDPQFLSEVEVPVSDFILGQARQQLQSEKCQTNYFLDFILRGRFGVALPHYVRPENFAKIKANISKLVVCEGYAQDAFSTYPEFNKFNLSNIFEYMNLDTFKEVVSELIAHGPQGAKYAYWNLMVPRSMAKSDALLSDVIQTNQADTGFFYSKFHLNEKL